MRTRSFLPYDLAFDLNRTIADRRAGLLEARLTGDLEGIIHRTIEAADDGCLITFDEDVVTHETALNRLAPLLRPAYSVNHIERRTVDLVRVRVVLRYTDSSTVFTFGV